MRTERLLILVCFKAEENRACAEAKVAAVQRGSF